MKSNTTLIQVLHPFLGEGRSDDVTGQVFHCRIIFWRYAVAAEDMEPNTGNGGLRKVSAERCDKNE